MSCHSMISVLTVLQKPGILCSDQWCLDAVRDLLRANTSWCHIPACPFLQEAEQTKDAGAAAYEAARTQQEADKAQAAIKEASAALHAAQSQDKPEEPLLEPIDRDAAYFKVSYQIQLQQANAR